jgi:hypothetical protein
MAKPPKSYTTIIDFATGRRVPDVGAEGNRQALEKILVNEKGYAREEIAIDVPLEIDIGDDHYRSAVDLVVTIAGRPAMAVKCAAGSLGSREREILAASRLLKDVPVPLAVVSDGDTAIVLDTVSGRRLAEGRQALPDRASLLRRLHFHTPQPLDEKRREREKLIFRSYDSMNVNIGRRLDDKGQDH